jgi:hypothetical protein
LAAISVTGIPSRIFTEMGSRTRYRRPCRRCNLVSDSDEYLRGLLDEYDVAAISR